MRSSDSDSPYSSEGYSSGPPSSDSTEYTRQLKNILQGVVNLIPPQMFLQAIILGDYSALQTMAVKAKFFKILRDFSELRTNVLRSIEERFTRNKVSAPVLDEVMNEAAFKREHGRGHDILFAGKDYLIDQIKLLEISLPLYPVFYILEFFQSLFFGELKRYSQLEYVPMYFSEVVAGAISDGEQNEEKRPLPNAISYMMDWYLNATSRDTLRTVELLVLFVYLATPELYSHNDSVKSVMDKFAIAIKKEELPQDRITAAYNSIGLLRERMNINQDFQTWELRAAAINFLDKYALVIKKSIERRGRLVSPLWRLLYLIGSISVNKFIRAIVFNDCRGIIEAPGVLAEFSLLQQDYIDMYVAKKEALRGLEQERLISSGDYSPGDDEVDPGDGSRTPPLEIRDQLATAASSAEGYAMAKFRKFDRKYPLQLIFAPLVLLEEVYEGKELIAREVRLGCFPSFSGAFLRIIGRQREAMGTGEQLLPTKVEIFHRIMQRFLAEPNDNAVRLFDLLLLFIFVFTPALYKNDFLKRRMNAWTSSVTTTPATEKKDVLQAITMLFMLSHYCQNKFVGVVQQKIEGRLIKCFSIVKDVARKKFEVESIPDKSITFTNIVNRLNRIAHVIDLNKLITFVRDGVWKVNISKKSLRRQLELFVIEVYWFLETFDIDDGGEFLGAYLRRHIDERISKKPMVILALNLVPFILYGLQQQPLFGERYIAKIKRLNDVVRSFGLSAITNFAQVGESYMEYLQITTRDMDKQRKNATQLLDLFIRCCSESQERFQEDFWWTRECSGGAFSRVSLKSNLEVLLRSFQEPQDYLNISRMEMSAVSGELWWLLKELNKRDGEGLPSGLERPVLMFM